MGSPHIRVSKRCNSLPTPRPEILSSGIPADLEPSIRSLLAQGRKIDAVELLRSAQHIGLTDAMSRIKALDQSMKAEV